MVNTRRGVARLDSTLSLRCDGLPESFGFCLGQEGAQISKEQAKESERERGREIAKRGERERVDEKVDFQEISL